MSVDAGGGEAKRATNNVPSFLSLFMELLPLKGQGCKSLILITSLCVQKIELLILQLCQ